MPIVRHLATRLHQAVDQFPVVTVTGPRQSGKTTLVRAALDDYQYVNLEAPDQRNLARDDPRGFLAQFGPKLIIDEAQHVPELFSYIQVVADQSGRSGQFVLTGSQSSFSIPDCCATCCVSVRRQILPGTLRAGWCSSRGWSPRR